ncbi:MAG TPA: DUF6178 family protein [Myxococcaceae bacterium]|nr:DUF6178 family protein [Myxococcaceae bacterium]
MASSGNGRDAASERALALQRISVLPARERLDALIASSDTAALIRALPPEQLYATVAEVGLADATELVQLATPAQFQALVDLGAWKRDSLDPHGLLQWIGAARGDDAEGLLRKVHGLDLELLESMLRAFTVVHDLEENPDPHVEGVTLDSADGRYRVEMKVEGAEQAALRTLLLDLMAEDPFAFSRLLEALRWELPTEMEEAALRFRWARLSDLGFPDPESAAGLYAAVRLPPPPAAAASAELVRTGPRRVDFVQAALEGLEPVEAENALEELRGVFNAALVADGADPGDLEAFRASAERARDTLGLGLEYLTGGDPRRGAAVVRDTPFRQIFQTGFSLGLRLRHRADRLAARPLARVDGEWMLWPEQAAVLGALRRPRPMRALPVEGAEPVPFRSLAEIHHAERELERAEQQQALLASLLGNDEDRARAALDSLGVAWPAGGTPAILAAAVSHALLDRTARVAPVPAARTRALGRAFLDPGPPPTARPEAVTRAAAALAAVSPGEESGRLARLVLERLADQIGGALLAGPLPVEVQTTLPWSAEL